MSRYLPVTFIVLLLGVGMILYPDNIEIHVADEQVNMWAETKATSRSSFGEDRSSASGPGPSPWMRTVSRRC